MNALADPTAPRPAGLLTRRETNKFEKLRRIQQAARELFVAHGYDQTTMRGIAERAGVAPGTLFLYASNKRDLLFLIANEAMERVVDDAVAMMDERDELLPNFLLLAGLHFRLFGDQPDLFRLVLRELLFSDSGVQAERANTNRLRLLGVIQGLVEDAVRRAEVAGAVDSALAARLLFATLQAEVRSWMAAERRDLAAGLERYWTMLSLVLGGLLAGPAHRPTGRDIQRLVTRLTAG